MKLALPEYCREVDEKAEQFAQAAEISERAGHLQAFNFGRMAQRIQGEKSDGWLRVGWLLVGLAVGAAIGGAYPDYLYPALAHKYLTKAGHNVRKAEKLPLWRVWKGWR